jgi:hypothetical protein
MARDIVSEAVEQAEAMKKAAYENAKNVLVEAMSTNLKAAVTEAIDEKIDDADVNTEDTVDEASVEEGKDFGGDKGDESKSHRDFEESELPDEDLDEDEDEEEIADDGYDEDDDDGELEGEDDLEEIDIEEVIEIIEDEDEDEEEVDIDVDVDTDEDDEEDDDDEEIDEDKDYGGNKGDESRSDRDYEAAVQENKQLRKENKRYAKALTFLKTRIDEVNLFNARLAAASDLMSGVSLTKEEKEKVVEHFDGCKDVNEVKRTFKVLNEAYTNTDRVVKKQRVDRPNVQSVISEETKAKDATATAFERLSQLAGI